MSDFEKILNEVITKRGFFWQTADIYGGISGFYDYGHLGTLIKRNWEDSWLKYFLNLGDNYYLIESATILPEEVLKASGHVDHFTDILIKCSNCQETFRGDHLINKKISLDKEITSLDEIFKYIQEFNIVCENCGGEFSNPSDFNMMFKLKIGATGKLIGYLRPETAQGAYLNFLHQFRALREKIPMGLAIIGKAYRNEISPRQGFFRVREFTQAELQIFHDPKNFDELFDLNSIKNYQINLCLVQDRKKRDFIRRTCKEIKEITGLPDSYIYHMAKIQQFYLDLLNFPPEKIRFYEKSKEERAFYNRFHFDIEFNFKQFGSFEEIAGLHYRGDHDLSSHQKMSNKKLEVTTTDKRKTILNVLELSFGVDRNILAVLDGNFHIENERNILKIPPILAPYHIGILPLQKRDGLPEKSKELKKLLSTRFRVFYDESGSIGKRYARLDEIGVPFCLTVDYETLDKNSSDYNTVTIRFRNTKEQIRVTLDDLMSWFVNNLV